MMKKHRSFRVEDQLWELFKEECNEKTTTPSRILRKTIKEFIDLNKIQNGKK